MEISRKRADTARGPEEHFTGTVWMDQLGATGHATLLSVHFAPGARTAWHAHPDGQVLHVIEGVGRVQSRGGDREEITAGDTVEAAPGEWHWHGAAPGTFMTHIAVSDGTTKWAEHVTDHDYQG